MTRLILRATLALSLLGGLSLGGVGAAGPSLARTPQSPPQPAPQRVPGGANVNSKAIQDALPTLDLLITVQLLPGLLERGEITLDAVARQELRALLRPLLTRKALRPADARPLEAALHAALSPSQNLALGQARAALESRARALMARARFATPDGPLNLTLTRYGLMVAGGPDTVRAVVGASFNPYSEAGVNADLLARLLVLLER